MATEMINIRLEKDFLAKIDKIVEKDNYQSRTEFIRNALRKIVVEGEEYQQFRAKIAKIQEKQFGRKPLSEEEYEKIRNSDFDEKSRKAALRLLNKL